MYCEDCGQKLSDHLGKKCIFSRDSAILLKGFMLSCYLTLSRFNKNYVTYPIKELYDNFAILQNLPTSFDLQRIYPDEDWEDLIFLSIENLEKDKVFNAFVRGEFDDSNYEWFMYNDDSSFSKLSFDTSRLTKLRMEDVKGKSNKALWGVMNNG